MDPSILLGSRNMKATKGTRKLKISGKMARKKRIQHSLRNFIITASTNFCVNI